MPWYLLQRTPNWEDGALSRYELNCTATIGEAGIGPSGINTWYGGWGIPWSRTDPSLGATKSVAFASATNHFRADTSESWVARLCEQVYIDLA